jgi:hypothetical protein
MRSTDTRNRTQAWERVEQLEGDLGAATRRLQMVAAAGVAPPAEISLTSDAPFGMAIDFADEPATARALRVLRN